MSTFGDGERGEAEGERLAEMEMMHLPMKKWFLNDASEALKEVWSNKPSLNAPLVMLLIASYIHNIFFGRACTSKT